MIRTHERSAPAAPIAPAAGADRDDSLTVGRGSARPYERDASIGELFTRQAQTTPDAVAVAADTGQQTYAEVERRSNQLARYLAAAGVDAGSRVGVALERSADLPVTLLAILKAGAAYVPLDLSYPAERLRLMIEDAAIGTIVTGEMLDPQLEFAGRAVRIDRDAAAIAAFGFEPLSIGVAAVATAYVTYTSGSTGRPKGVAVPHRGVVRLVRGADYVTIRPDDGYLQLAPLAFDASTFEIWAPLLNGARLAIPRPGLLSVDDIADAIARFETTTLFVTTALFGRIVDRGRSEFGRVRQLFTGGEVASPSHMCRFLAAYPACALIAVYGPTENTTFSTWHPLPDAAAVGSNVPIGRPIANSTAYVVDDAGQPAPVGVTGELWVGGDGVAAGYLNRAGLTAERFIADPFDAAGAGRIYKTGDRARWRSDMVLEFLGRTDDQVKIRGFRIELGEIEAALQSHPAVADAAVVVAPAGGEKTLFAFVAAPPGAVGDSALRSYIALKLPRYMLPHRITVMPELPETASGKVDRVALTRAAAAEPAVAPAASAAQPVVAQQARGPARPGAAQRELQTALGAIWCETLGLDVPPDADVNFFDAGGDSLRLLTVHAKIQERFGTNVQIMALFEHTTLRKLAAFLAKTEVRR